MLEGTKNHVLEEYEKKKDVNLTLDAFLTGASGKSFYNISPWNFRKLLGDPNNIKRNLNNYIDGFSEQIRDVFERFNFSTIIEGLDD